MARFFFFLAFPQINFELCFLQSEFEFLDLTGLNAEDRDDLTAILRPTVITATIATTAITTPPTPTINDVAHVPTWDRPELAYAVIPEEQIEPQEMPKVWQQYGK